MADGVDFVIEAATENVGLKRQIFTDLDKICGSDVILSTNTSSIAIGRIAEATKRPEQVIGMHFMNPVRACACMCVRVWCVRMWI